MQTFILYKVVRVVPKQKAMPTAHEIRKSREILSKIDQHIPVRGYVKDVQRMFEEKGLEVPKAYRIQAVRHGRTYDLNIMKALESISRILDKDDRFIEPPAWEAPTQLPLKIATHRSRGKVKAKTV